ncbi:hypothetical protein ACFYXM_05540 [Streptomyces sp. NPDC002476]|uniref:hypothetical protein n=1 Tax=Streptomyces sp. NPDC002476 TaxID=3364648 RepID=UPI0036C049D1
MKKSVIAATAAAILVAGGGAVYATGVYDNWRDGRALEAGCRGLVDPVEMKRALGAERVSGKGTTGGGCQAFDPGGTNASVTISLQRGADPESVVVNADRILDQHPAGVLVPVSGGWPALVSAGSGTESYATAFLPCGKGRSDDLLLSLSAVRARSTGTVQERRDALAALVTRAVERAADEQHCVLSANEEKKGVSSEAFARLKQAGEASGSCRGIRYPAYETEADGSAPVEQCLLADPDGRQTFRLAAYYGPYPKAPRRDPHRNPHDYVGRSGDSGQRSWTTANCPIGEALYTLEPVRPQAAASERERAALRRFAAESARRHGCGTPAEAADR